MVAWPALVGAQVRGPGADPGPRTPPVAGLREFFSKTSPRVFLKKTDFVILCFPGFLDFLGRLRARVGRAVRPRLKNYSTCL